MTNDTPPRTPKRGKGRPPKDRNDPKTLAIAQDKLEAWRLRYEEKMTYRQIAHRLNLNHQTVFEYINEKPDAIKKQTSQYRQNYIDQQLEEIEDMIKLARGQLNSLAVYTNPANDKLNMDTKDVIASARARADLIRTISQLLERQAKLLGLDEPTRVQSENKDVMFVMDLTGTTHDNGNS